MNPRVLLVGFLLCLLAVPSVSALGTKYWDARLYPEEGSTTQSITILVRMANGEEPTGTTPRYVYVFYDGVALLKSQASPLVSGSYVYKWDLAITVPQTESTAAYGEHEVTVRLEESDGEATEKTLTYTISSGKPVGNWFDALTDAQKASLKGAKGDTGPQGEQGPAGADGADASIDYNILKDYVDYSRIWDNVPADVLAEMKGAKGDAGAAGRDSDPTVLYLCLVLCSVNTVTWLLPKLRERVKRVKPPFS